jgi:replicative DNA helicase
MILDFSTDIVERLLFKQIVKDKNCMNICANIFDKRWIQTEHLGNIIQISINYFKKYGSMPNVKVIKALLSKYVENNSLNMSELNNLIDNCLNLDVGVDDDVLLLNLKEFIRRKALWTAIIDNVDDIEKNSDNVLDKCLSRFDTITKITFNDQDLGLKYFDPDGMEKHWEFINNPDDKLSIGWPFLDKITNGGFLKDGRMLALLMAQPGLGKSNFMANMAFNFLKQNKSVVVISLEMSQDVYAQRFDALISGDDINKLKDTAATSREKINAFYQKYPNANLFIKEYPPRSIKCSDIEIYLENLKLNGHHFDVVIVDYLNLVLPSSRVDNMFKDGLDVSEKMRALSYKFNCPVISAVQSNTSGFNTEAIGMENVSESRGIVHTCDFLAALMQLQEDKENGIVKMKILKNRLGGQLGQIGIFTMDTSTLLLSDITFDTGANTLNMSSESDNLLRNMKKIGDDINNL